jgi:DnaJ-class molecular chaperone
MPIQQLVRHSPKTMSKNKPRRIYLEKLTVCHVCGGEGKQELEVYIEVLDEWNSISEDCRHCDGTGDIKYVWH